MNKKMINPAKIRIIVAVFGIVISLCSSGVVTAQKDKQNPSDCSPGPGECGITSDGTVIMGICKCN